MTSGTTEPAPQPTSAATTEPSPPSPQPWEVPPGYPPYPPYTEYRPDRITRMFMRLNAKSPMWLAPLSVLTCIAGAAAYTVVTHPTDAAAGESPTCLLKYTTGFDCPGCGGTRAAWYLLHGNLGAAARHHAVFVFAVPFLLWMYVAWAGRRLFGWNLPQLKLSPRAVGVFLAVWGVWSVARNLPWSPFTSLYV